MVNKSTSGASVAWRCPVCAGTFDSDAAGLFCAGGHRFDRSKEGYVNLVLPNQRGSANPGDGAEMMRARREWLDAGYYAPLATHIGDCAVAHSARKSSLVLDAGCGEGYYAGVVDRALREVDHPAGVAGIDVSKAAIRMAAKRHSDLNFAVASSFRIPIADATCGMLIRVFAPGPMDELSRVLAPDASLLIVRPGPYHLCELRELLYAVPRPHAPGETLVSNGLSVRRSERLGYTLSLDSPQAIRSLIKMTPYYWTLTDERRATVDALSTLKLTVDFELTLLNFR